MALGRDSTTVPSISMAPSFLGISSHFFSRRQLAAVAGPTSQFTPGARQNTNPVVLAHRRPATYPRVAPAGGPGSGSAPGDGPAQDRPLDRPGQDEQAQNADRPDRPELAEAVGVGEPGDEPDPGEQHGQARPPGHRGHQ